MNTLPGTLPSCQHKQHKDQARRNLKSATDYVKALKERYARLLVVRVDFGYRAEALESVSLYELSQARISYFKNLKLNPKLKSLVGYLWVIEEGEKKGPHLHGMFFFDGSRSCHDARLGQELGERWLAITQGKGYYFNINTDQSKQNLMDWQQTEDYRHFINQCFPGQAYQRQEQIVGAQSQGINSLALGQVEYHNQVAWFNVYLQLHYFTKLEQRIPYPLRQGVRCFGKGQFPQALSRPGRPRTRWNDYTSQNTEKSEVGLSPLLGPDLSDLLNCGV